MSVGLLAGAVGAGGSFLLLPLMVYVLHVPHRLAAGSSLAIAVMGASTGLVGKIVTHQVPDPAMRARLWARISDFLLRHLGVD